MSYILSALEKAEDQRRGDRSPDASVPAREFGTALEPASAPRRTLHLAVLVLALVGALAAVAFWLRPIADDPGPAAGAGDTLARTPEPAPAAMPARPSGSEPNPPSSPAPGTPERVSASPNTGHSSTLQTPKVENAAPATDGEPPQLNITGYIYFDSKPDASKLFVDGIVYRLGSSVEPGVTVREFRRHSVVLSRSGTRHEIPVP